MSQVRHAYPTVPPGARLQDSVMDFSVFQSSANRDAY